MKQTNIKELFDLLKKIDIKIIWSGSYIDSPYWIKNKKAKIDPINKKDDKCFQYALTVVLKQ